MDDTVEVGSRGGKAEAIRLLLRVRRVCFMFVSEKAETTAASYTFSAHVVVVVRRRRPLRVVLIAGACSFGCECAASKTLQFKVQLSLDSCDIVN
jgi:hypothetical protein